MTTAELIPDVRDLLGRVYGACGLPAPVFADDAIAEALLEAAGTCKPGQNPGRDGCVAATAGSSSDSATPSAPAAGKPSWDAMADTAPGLGEHERKILRSDAPLGDKIHAASAADTRVFDPLFRSGEAASAGIPHNEVLRSLDTVYRAHKSTDLPSPKRINADLDGVKASAEQSVAGLRKLGKHDAADWYETHGMAMIDHARSDLMPAKPVAGPAVKAPAPKAKQPEALSITPGQKAKVDGIPFVQKADGSWFHKDFPDRKDLTATNDDMRRWKEKNKVVFESACPSCGPDCGCEPCQAKRTPLLETPGLIDVPDSRQSESWSCGAAVCSAVAAYYGVEPNTEPEAVLALGSSPRDGTDPEHLVAVLQGAGLETTALAGMDLDTLEWFVSKGRPVICAIQAWGDVPIQEAAGTCKVGQNPARDKCVAASGDAPAAKDKSPEKNASQSQVAPKEEVRKANKIAKAKVASAPVPSREDVKKARMELAAARRGEIRAGGESRGGSAASRRKQRENLFNEFGGAEKGYVVCPWTGIKMHHTDDPKLNPKGYPKFERGKIFVKCQGGGYQLSNLVPESFAANRARNDKRLRKENSDGC